MEQVTTQAAVTQAPSSSSLLERLLFGLAVAALALAPTQLTVTVKSISLAPSELLLLMAAVLWAVRWLVVRDTKSLPPISHWVLVGAMLLSVMALGDILLGTLPEEQKQAAYRGAIKGVLKEGVQLGIYLLVGVTVFRAVLTSPARIRTAVVALLATTTVAVLLGTMQWWMLKHQYEPDPSRRVVFGDRAARSEDPEAKEHKDDHKVFGIHDPIKGAVNPEQPGAGYDVNKGFTPRNKAVAYTIVETPIQVSSTFGSWNKHGFHASRTAYAGFLALVLPFALALLVSEGKKRHIAVWMGLLLLGAAASVLAGYVVPAILIGLLITGAALAPRVGKWVLVGVLVYLIPMSLVSGFNRQEVLLAPFQLQITQAEANERYDDGTPHVKKFWGEQQAALNVFRHSVLFGVGAGRYQEKIADGYDGLGAVEKQRLESDAQNGYIFMAMTTGILGLGALLFLFGSYFQQARRQLQQRVRSPWAAALLGALVALILITLVTNPWVRGTAVVAAALLAVIGNGAAVARDEAEA